MKKEKKKHSVAFKKSTKKQVSIIKKDTKKHVVADKKNAKVLNDGANERKFEKELSLAEQKSNRHTAIIAGLVTCIISGIISFCISYNNNNNSREIMIAEINNNNKPVLALKHYNYCPFEIDLLGDIDKNHEEYLMLKTEGFDKKGNLAGVLQIDLEVENIGNGALLDLDINSIGEGANVADGEKEYLAKSIKENFFNESTISEPAKLIEIDNSPINISKDSSKFVKLLLFHRNTKVDDLYKSICYSICRYKDINDKNYFALLEIEYNIPILNKTNDDDRQELKCAIYQEHSKKYQEILDDKPDILEFINNLK